jgi:MFS family permease
MCSRHARSVVLKLTAGLGGMRPVPTGRAFFQKACTDDGAAGWFNATSTNATSSNGSSSAGGDDCGSDHLIQSFAVFGGAFLMRPLGAVIFGKIGDTYGRCLFLVAV